MPDDAVDDRGELTPDRPEAVLGVAAVARRLGVATGTLRTWDRRYGLGPSGHTAGSRRRYTARDLARLEVMRGLMIEGVTPAEAARVALESELGEVDGQLVAHRPRGRRRTERAGGGRVVPLRDASPAARGLARAAMSLDADACTSMLLAGLRRRGVVATWDEVLLPVLGGVGERWRSTGHGVEVEHLLSECAETALRTGVRPREPLPGVRPVLLAGLEPEDHRLPLVALAAALGEQAVRVRMLGVRLPLQALGDAVARTGPAAVFLWSHGASGPAALPPSELLSVRPRPALVLGGRGWQEERYNPAVIRVDDLAGAVSTLVSLTSSAHGASGGAR